MKYLVLLLLAFSSSGIAAQSVHYYQALKSMDFPPCEGNNNCLWLVNAYRTPIENVQIKLELYPEFIPNAMPKSGGAVPINLKSDKNGIYLLDTLGSGLFHFSICAEGYDTLSFHLRMTKNSGTKFRVVLCPKGSRAFYLPEKSGIYPVLGSPEFVSIHSNKKSDSLNDLCAAQPWLNQHGKLKNCIEWPKTIEERQQLTQYLEQHPSLSISKLFLWGGPDKAVMELGPSFSATIDAVLDSISILKAFKNFQINSLKREKIPFSLNHWTIKATYKNPLSLDFLKELAAISALYPVYQVQLDLKVNNTTDKQHNANSDKGATYIHLWQASEKGVVHAVANGVLMSDGACSAKLVFGIQHKKDGQWQEVIMDNTQMDCGLSFIFVEHQIWSVDLNAWYSYTFGAHRDPLEIGEYRLLVRDAHLKYHYSESFWYDPSR